MIVVMTPVTKVMADVWSVMRSDKSGGPMIVPLKIVSVSVSVTMIGVVLGK